MTDRDCDFIQTREQFWAKCKLVFWSVVAIALVIWGGVALSVPAPVLDDLLEDCLANGGCVILRQDDYKERCK